MSFSSRKKLPFNLPLPMDLPHNLPNICGLSAYAPQTGPSPSTFPRSSYYTLTVTEPATGPVPPASYSSLEVLYTGVQAVIYVFSIWDFPTTVLQTSREVPTPRAAFTLSS
jgi:hypothetical protein